MPKTIPLTTHIPKTHPIVYVKKETDDVTSFTFNTTFGSKPGQFLMVWLPGVDEVPMSIALDDGKQTRITFFAVGDMTKKLSELKEGDLVGLRGPFGTHYEWEPNQHLMLVAGGYGAAPMFFVANEAVKDGCTIDFIVGARSKDQLLYLDEIKKLKNTTLHTATDDGSEGHKSYNTEVLENLIKEGHASSTQKPCHAERSPPQRTETKHQHGFCSAQHDTSVFSCGPELMMKRVFEICEEREVDCAVSLERYMKCGYGLCGNCVMDPLGIRICVDGPVVKSKVLRELSEFGSYHRDDVGRKKSI